MAIFSKNFGGHGPFAPSGYAYGGKGGHNSPGANSLRGRWITAGGAEKSQECHK